MKRTL